MLDHVVPAMATDSQYTKISVAIFASGFGKSLNDVLCSSIEDREMRIFRAMFKGSVGQPKYASYSKVPIIFVEGRANIYLKHPRSASRTEICPIFVEDRVNFVHNFPGTLAIPRFFASLLEAERMRS